MINKILFINYIILFYKNFTKIYFVLKQFYTYETKNILLINIKAVLIPCFKLNFIYYFYSYLRFQFFQQLNYYLNFHYYLLMNCLN